MQTATIEAWPFKTISKTYKLILVIINKYHQIGDYEYSLKEKKMRQKEIYKNCLDVRKYTYFKLKAQSQYSSKSNSKGKLGKKEDNFANPCKSFF